MMQDRFCKANVVSGLKSLHRRPIAQSPGKKRILRMIPRITGRPQTKWQLKAALFGLVLLSTVALISFNTSENGSRRRLPDEPLFKEGQNVYFKDASIANKYGLYLPNTGVWVTIKEVIPQANGITYLLASKYLKRGDGHSELIADFRNRNKKKIAIPEDHLVSSKPSPRPVTQRAKPHRVHVFTRDSISKGSYLEDLKPRMTYVQKNSSGKKLIITSFDIDDSQANVVYEDGTHGKLPKAEILKLTRVTEPIKLTHQLKNSTHSTKVQLVHRKGNNILVIFKDKKWERVDLGNGFSLIDQRNVSRSKGFNCRTEDKDSKDAMRAMRHEMNVLKSSTLGYRTDGNTSSAEAARCREGKDAEYTRREMQNQIAAMGAATSTKGQHMSHSELERMARRKKSKRMLNRHIENHLALVKRNKTNSKKLLEAGKYYKINNFYTAQVDTVVTTGKEIDSKSIDEILPEGGCGKPHYGKTYMIEGNNCSKGCAKLTGAPVIVPYNDKGEECLRAKIEFTFNKCLEEGFVTLVKPVDGRLKRMLE